ncbi:MAG: preprotein translocase subunit SecE [Acholeplasmataceae bacterium]
MAIKQKQEEQQSKLLEVLTTEYRWENLLLGVLATIAISISLMIISGNTLLQINPDFPILGEGSNGLIFAWVLFAISAFGLILVLYPFFLPAIPEIKKISWAKWHKFLDNSVRVLVFLTIITGFLLLYNFLIAKLISGLLGGTL